jgi:hypothetical protein
MRRAVALVLMAVMGVWLLGVVNAFAGGPGDISREIAMQQKRINRGVADGQLSPRESAVVQDNLDRIRARFERMKADGLLTPGELANLSGLLGRNSRMIYNKKHNYERIAF